MSDEKLVAQMNDARLLNAVDNVLVPALEHKISVKLEQACARFRGGETSFLAEVAYMTAIKDLLLEIRQKQTRGHQAIKELHERAEEK